MKTLMTAGKGGTGKSSLLAYGYRLGLLEELPGRILLVDADPHQALGHLLGLENVLTLGEMRHRYQIGLKNGTGLEALSRREFAQQLAREALHLLSERVDGLLMGRNDEPGCQCVVNSLLGSALDALAGEYDWVVVDNEAGIEPIGRHGWTVDVLLLVATPQPLDVWVSHQILRQARDTGREVRQSYLVLNRHREGNLDAEFPAPLLGRLPCSAQLEEGAFPEADWVAALQEMWKRLLVEIGIVEKC